MTILTSTNPAQLNIVGRYILVLDGLVLASPAQLDIVPKEAQVALGILINTTPTNVSINMKPVQAILGTLINVRSVRMRIVGKRTKVGLEALQRITWGTSIKLSNHRQYIKVRR